MKVIVKPVLSSADYKVLLVSGKTEAVLDKHKVNEPAILLVKKGTVTYQEVDAEPITLQESQGHNIPAEIYHQVTCENEAEIFLLIPKKAKLRFER